MKKVTFKQKVIIIGGGEHGGVVANILSQHYTIVGFLDNKNRVPSCYKLLGTINEWKKFATKSATFFVAIGNNKMRAEVTEKLLQNKIVCAQAIHPTAVVETTAQLGVNVMVGAQSYVGNYTVIEKGAIVNNGCTVEHDNHMSQYSHYAPGTVTGGGVALGRESFVGLGAVINDHCHIGDYTVIGSGSVVINDISNSVIAVGVPAKVIKRL